MKRMKHKIKLALLEQEKKATYVVTFKSEEVGLYKYVLIAKPSLLKQDQK